MGGSKTPGISFAVSWMHSAAYHTGTKYMIEGGTVPMI